MAMHEAGITPSKKVTVSSDVIPDAISLLREGELAASVDPRFDQQTSRALRSLVDYIRDQRKPAEKIVLTKGELVTKATVSAPGNPR